MLVYYCLWDLDSKGISVSGKCAARPREKVRQAVSKFRGAERK